MEVLANLVPNFIEIFKISFAIFINGGWVIFVVGLVYMMWFLYLHEIQHQFVDSIKWTFLNIKVPRENMTSTLAVEGVFSQMHALHAGLTFPDAYIEGKIQQWYSLELISMGGKISFIIRTPTAMKEVVKASFYSHYPQAEISEVADYMENFHYDPDVPGEYEIFGTEWKLTDSEVIPLKTYKDFEHVAAEEKIIDPLANVFEALSKMAPHEFFGVQILTQPLADEEWLFKAQHKIKELTGEEIPHEASFWGFILSPFHWFAGFSYKDTFFGGHHGHDEEQNKPRNNWMSMTEAEKERVNRIGEKIGKPGYKTKIRYLYIAPVKEFDLTKRSLMVGAFRPFGSVMTNKLKPDVGNSHTWTGVDYNFSKTLEQPYLDWLLKKKKRLMLKGYKNRSISIGRPGFILNIEELATLYHFPITTKTTLAPSSVEKTDTKKSQPPVDLPIVPGGL